jgi:hypothetical protein
VGGVSYINSHGRIVAGSLDSYSTCPCRARLIPSVFTATYESRSSAAPQTTRAAAQPNPPLAGNPAAPRQSGSPLQVIRLQPHSTEQICRTPASTLSPTA